ncbi:hypothetical protein [uncultured Paludibaculum sp.]|uniref:hypothetical protein n=1 Tax=uncultured Paludibaculum sp. TaxID=1765020 RepID=UPI002AAB1EBE|nr:hypothetical protein [uncultured Paludibaculum sp.]
MNWRPFRYGLEEYDLCHLHPATITYTQEARGGKPARCYAVDVVYSMHCFTRGIKADERPNPDLCYRDSRETRVFDFRRYELSRQLPGIIRDLCTRKVYHSGRGNFFTIEIIDKRTGARLEYEIYFVASRSSRKGRIDLVVQSAYVRDPEHLANRPKLKPIAFPVILFNVLNNKEIRVPK